MNEAVITYRFIDGRLLAHSAILVATRKTLVFKETVRDDHGANASELLCRY